MTERKTQRKNKTKQVLNWPSADGYFTIKQLVAMNQHMLTNAPKPSDITIRVRLKKAIDELNLVAEIGSKNCGKGRPEKAFAMRPVKQSALDQAKANGIILDSPKLLTVMDVSPTTQPTPTTPAVTPVTNVVSETVSA